MTRTNASIGRAGWTTLVALAMWGLVHVAGGVSLLVAGTREGLETLGPNSTSTVPPEPGDTVEALLRFHSLNIVLGGLAVLTLTGSWWRSRAQWQLGTAVAIAVALDIGLIAFFVVPDVLPASQGLIGPVLVLVAAVGVVVWQRQRQQPTVNAATPS